MKKKNHIVSDKLSSQLRTMRSRLCKKFHQSVCSRANVKYKISFNSVQMYYNHLVCEVAIKHNVK